MIFDQDIPGDKKFNIFRKFFLFKFFLCSIFPLHSYATYAEAERIYENAILSNPLISEIHADGLERRRLESQQLGLLLSSISENDQVDSETLRKLVLDGYQDDLAFFKGIDEQLKEYKEGRCRGASIPLLYNKMSKITQNALCLAQDENQFFDILEGRLPKGYSLEIPTFNYFPDETHIFSVGGRGNALKSLLLKIWMIQNGRSSLSFVGSLFEDGGIDEAPFLHITPLPDDFHIETDRTSPYFFSDSRTPKAILTIHNGYAFGGHRGERRYHSGKKWGPQDCSSFTAKYVKSARSFSTRDQAILFQLANGFQFAQVTDNSLVEKWEQQDEDIKNVRSVLTPLGLHPDPNTLKPGLIHAERTYNRNTKKLYKKLAGKAGHTGIFLGMIGSGSDAKALTISAARDLEGSGKEFVYGVEERPLFSTEGERLIMFFDVR